MQHIEYFPADMIVSLFHQTYLVYLSNNSFCFRADILPMMLWHFIQPLVSVFMSVIVVIFEVFAGIFSPKYIQ